MKNLVLLLIFFSFFSSYAQDKKIVAEKIDFTPAIYDEFVGRDQYGYHYFINNAVLYKIKDNEIFEYKNVSLGRISKVAIENPLKIVLFYEDFNTVVLLDNQLNETQNINFSKNDYSILVTAVGIASQNQLWIFNQLSQQIGLYDYLKDTYRSISTSLPEPVKIYETDFNAFYWIDSRNNFFMCSPFGKITFLGEGLDFDWIAIASKNKYVFSKGHSIYLVNSAKREKFKIEISEKTFAKCYYKDQILSIFTSEGITNYKIAIP